MSNNDRKPATRLVEAGRKREWTSVPGNKGRVVSPPVWRASTHLYEDCADLAGGRPNEDGHFYYGRRGGPTQWALADALTELEPDADGTELFPSGVAAIACTLMALLRPGDEIALKEKAKNIPAILEAIASVERDVPEYVEADHNKFTARFVRVPTLDALPGTDGTEPGRRILLALIRGTDHQGKQFQGGGHGAALFLLRIFAWRSGVALG